MQSAPRHGRIFTLAAVVVITVALAACGDGDDGEGSGDATTDAEVTMTDPPAPDPGGDDQPAVTVPPSAQARVDEAVADLAARVGADAETISVADYRDVTWSDASLGCPQPDMSYIQRLTPGVLLVLRAADGATFEYHGGSDGALSYCDAPRPPVQGEGAD
jgi:hypothetical protein